MSDETVSDPRSTHLRGETVDSRREVMEAFVAKLGVTRDAGWPGDVAHIALGTWHGMPNRTVKSVIYFDLILKNVISPWLGSRDLTVPDPAWQAPSRLALAPG